MPFSIASAIDTTGLKCAPEIGPNARISATSAAPVAIVFASRAIATSPPDHAIRNDHVNRVVRQRNVLDLTFQKLDIFGAGFAFVFVRRASISSVISRP
jgi:hypothetical protein